ncbi:methylenetetrahydrofolate reductase [Streptomyces sp. NPDC091217]|uniref:methylenetetrahydrofolate reductase n=1 Tax=Streptomyces sp. NPDC091217 TaxID=3365975 RepID=UPI0037FF53F8
MSSHRMAGDAETVRQLVRAATLEVIPLRTATDKLALIPPGTTISVTCSPKLGMSATLEYAAAARRSGLAVIPHLAARAIKDSSELEHIVARLAELGIDHIYVVGGDADEPAGDYSSAGELLEELDRSGHGFDSVGVACYPEGHPKIPDEVLLTELKRKQTFADYMVSQMCFDGTSLVDWLRHVRDSGVETPLRIGLAAPLKASKLVDLSMRIGVGTSLRYLTRQRGFVGNLLLGGTYRPEHLLHEIAGEVPPADLGISGVHLFSFNQVADAVQWRDAMLGNS